MLNLSAGEVLLEESPLVLLEDSAEGVDDLGSEEDLWRGFRRHRCFKAADTFKLLDADARMALRPNTQIITGIWHDTAHDTA